MASALYDLGRKKFADGDIDLLADNIKVTLIDSNDYTENLSTDEFYDDIPAGAKVAESGNLANKDTTAGTFDADDITFTSVTGDECEALVIWKDTGTPSTSPLIAFIDNATGLPVTPNGGDINVTWDSGADKIFTL